MLLKFALVLLVPHRRREEAMPLRDTAGEQRLLAWTRDQLKNRFSLADDQLEESLQTVEHYARQMSSGRLEEEYLLEILDDMASMRCLPHVAAV